MVGYDRYEGSTAWHALADLYAVLRLYVNYFQPSLKLLSKKHDGSKTTKKYDRAKTPCQRVMRSSFISDEVKNRMKVKYESLDPVELLKQLSTLQENFWRYASSNTLHQGDKLTASGEVGSNAIEAVSDGISRILNTNNMPNRKYRRTRKTKKERPTRTWRTRKNPFESSWGSLRQQLELSPHQTAKNLLEGLILVQPEKFKINQLRTLQRRVSLWRLEQLNLAKAEHLLLSDHDSEVNPYLSLVMEAGGG